MKRLFMMFFLLPLLMQNSFAEPPLAPTGEQQASVRSVSSKNYELPAIFRQLAVRSSNLSIPDIKSIMPDRSTFSIFMNVVGLWIGMFVFTALLSILGFVLLVS